MLLKAIWGLDGHMTCAQVTCLERFVPSHVISKYVLFWDQISLVLEVGENRGMHQYFGLAIGLLELWDRNKPRGGSNEDSSDYKAYIQLRLFWSFEAYHAIYFAMDILELLF